MSGIIISKKEKENPKIKNNANNISEEVITEIRELVNDYIKSGGFPTGDYQGILEAIEIKTNVDYEKLHSLFQKELKIVELRINNIEKILKKKGLEIKANVNQSNMLNDLDLWLKIEWIDRLSTKQKIEDWIDKSVELKSWFKNEKNRSLGEPSQEELEKE